MWSDVRTATTVALVWLVLTTLPSFIPFLRTRLGRWMRPFGIWGLLLLALIVRIVPLWMLPVGAGFDIDSYKLVGDAFFENEEIYSFVRGRHPYLPFFMYFLGASAYLARWTAIPFVIWVKLWPMLADLAIVAALFRFPPNHTGLVRDPMMRGLMYALNPVAIFVGVFHGQFDSIPIFFLLLSVYYLEFVPAERRSAIWLGLAIAIKSWPVVFLPIAFLRVKTWRRKSIYTAIAVLIPIGMVLGYLLIYQSGARPMLMRASTHSGNSGYWGLSSIFYAGGLVYPWSQWLFEQMHAMRRVLLILGGLYGLWLTRRQSGLVALLVIILIEFAVTSGFGIQWVLWPIAFGILVEDRPILNGYNVGALIALVAQNYGAHMINWLFIWFDQPTGDLLFRLIPLAGWIALLGWLGIWVRRLHLNPDWAGPQPAKG